jgi:hypothetical protein
MTSGSERGSSPGGFGGLLMPFALQILPPELLPDVADKAALDGRQPNDKRRKPEQDQMTMSTYGRDPDAS